jgi:hypothetical protein
LGITEYNFDNLWILILIANFTLGNIIYHYFKVLPLPYLYFVDFESANSIAESVNKDSKASNDQTDYTNIDFTEKNIDTNTNNE